tara:strand:- start:519 stop:3335 length:2817 start_codon:yes stop_codon:yes gene_type:complete
MSRARELAKVGGKNQQIVAGLSSHVGVSTFAADVFMYSNLEVTGTTTFNGGTLTLGDSASDNVVFGADVDSSIIPDDDNTYDLGSSTQEWRNIYIDGTANVDALLADTAKIGDLTNDRVVIVGTSGEIEDSANLTFNGSILTTTNVVVTGDTDLGNATSDTITATGRFDSDLTPSTDNARDLGASGLEWKDLYLDGTAHIDTLDVDENAAIIGTLDANGSKLTVGVGNTDVIVRGDMRVTGIASFGNGTVTINETTVKTGTSNLHNVGIEIAGVNVLGADTPIGENATIFNNGNATFAGTITAASLDISGNIDIDGTTNLDAVDIDGAVDMASNLTLAGNADFNGNLDVDGTSNLDAVDIDGAVDMASNLTLAGNADFNGNLDVDGTTDLDATNIVGTLTVTGDIAADNVTVNGNTVSTSSGNLTLDSSGGTVAVSDNITVSGNGSVTGTFDVDGATTLDGLTVAEGAAFSSTLDVDGATTLDGLTVAEAAAFSAGVTITGALDANGGASIDNVQIGVTNNNEIDTSSGNLVIDSAGGTTTVDDNLTVSGNLTVNGTTTTINSTTVAIDDKNFQVATGAADDAAADGAGLTVDSGDGDKTWNFEATGDNWGASENINLASGKVLKVNNTQILSATALSSAVVVDLASVNIDGGTDIGADIVDADEMLIDDGGGGTNRRSDMSRVKKYIWSSASSDLTASASGVVTLANSGVSAGTVGSATAIPIITVDSKGRVTNTTTTAIDQASIAVLDTSVAVTDTGSNGKITGKADNTTVYEATSGAFAVTGNITVSGTVDGRDVAGDGSKLDGIESAATADQTASEILTLIKTVDGSGSGLDADTLDGISSASFLRSDTSDTFTGTLTMAGSIIPSANGTQNLGSSGTRWANVYSSDIDLNNEWKGGNTIDQSWGSYLIEEGEHDLFLKNRRNGKSYRFMLEEV